MQTHESRSASKLSLFGEEPNLTTRPLTIQPGTGAHRTEGRIYKTRDIPMHEEAMRSNLGSWVRTGRTLHVIDIENLMGGPNSDVARIQLALQHYRTTANFAKGDHAYVGCDAHLLPSVHEAWPAVLIRPGRGPDGADHALLAVLDTEDISRRYSRVVLGSGDGIFTPIVSELLDHNVRVLIVALTGSLSRQLAEQAACKPMPRISEKLPRPYASGPAG